MPRPSKQSLQDLPPGAIVRKSASRPASDTERVLHAYLALLDAIERHGGNFEYPMEANPTGDPRVTYNNTLELQRFYASIQLADYEIPHMLRGDPEHKMINEKRMVVNALLERLKEDTSE